VVEFDGKCASGGMPQFTFEPGARERKVVNRVDILRRTLSLAEFDLGSENHRLDHHAEAEIVPALENLALLVCLRMAGGRRVIVKSHTIEIEGTRDRRLLLRATLRPASRLVEASWYWFSRFRNASRSACCCAESSV